MIIIIIVQGEKSIKVKGTYKSGMGVKMKDGASLISVFWLSYKQ